MPGEAPDVANEAITRRRGGALGAWRHRVAIGGESAAASDEADAGEGDPRPARRDRTPDSPPRRRASSRTRPAGTLAALVPALALGAAHAFATNSGGGTSATETPSPEVAFAPPFERATTARTAATSTADESAPDVAAAALPPTVFADGTGLPAGAGSAREGAPIYAERCAACHGSAGEGGRAPELVGDRALLASEAPDRGIAVYWPYAAPLYDYVRRAMPPDAPYSLGASETYAVIARLLELNGLVDADTRVDAPFLATLPMPNVDGFERAPD